MNTKLKRVALVLAALPCAVLATPTVTFQGEVTDQTCKVEINGQSSSVVLLPTVSSKDFGSTLSNGQTAGVTPFTVSVADCTPPSADLNIKTVFMGYDVNADTGVLGNRATDNAAQGYGIQLSQSSDGSNPVKLNGPTPVEGLVLAKDATDTSIDFSAQYYVLDAINAKAGKITAVAEYTLSYF